MVLLVAADVVYIQYCSVPHILYSSTVQECTTMMDHTKRAVMGGTVHSGSSSACWCGTGCASLLSLLSRPSSFLPFLLAALPAMADLASADSPFNFLAVACWRCLLLPACRTVVVASTSTVVVLLLVVD